MTVTIRRKLEPDPGRPRYFLTEPGSGIRFVPEGAPASVEEPEGITPTPSVDVGGTVDPAGPGA